MGGVGIAIVGMFWEFMVFFFFFRFLLIPVSQQLLYGDDDGASKAITKIAKSQLQLIKVPSRSVVRITGKHRARTLCLHSFPSSRML